MDKKLEDEWQHDHLAEKQDDDNFNEEEVLEDFEGEDYQNSLSWLDERNDQDGTSELRWYKKIIKKGEK